MIKNVFLKNNHKILDIYEFMQHVNNNNNANIYIAPLKQNSSGALMAQTNTVSVFV